MFVRGPAIRYILSYSLILATVGAMLRLIYVLTGQNVEFLAFFAVVFTLGEMLFLCMFIVSLVIFSVRTGMASACLLGCPRGCGGVIVPRGMSMYARRSRNGQEMVLTPC